MRTVYPTLLHSQLAPVGHGIEGWLVLVAAAGGSASRGGRGGYGSMDKFSVLAPFVAMPGAPGSFLFL